MSPVLRKSTFPAPPAGPSPRVAEVLPAVPAGCYVLVASPGGGEGDGRAVPMATGIAFGLGVLTVIGSHLPSGVRTFLLTLAVADGLGAVLVIAVFVTSAPNWAVPAGAVAVWALMYDSGVHATVPGVAPGMLLHLVPVVACVLLRIRDARCRAAGGGGRRIPRDGEAA